MTIDDPDEPPNVILSTRARAARPRDLNTHRNMRIRWRATVKCWAAALASADVSEGRGGQTRPASAAGTLGRAVIRSLPGGLRDVRGKVARHVSRWRSRGWQNLASQSPRPANLVSHREFLGVPWGALVCALCAGRSTCAIVLVLVQTCARALCVVDIDRSRGGPRAIAPRPIVRLRRRRGMHADVHTTSLAAGPFRRHLFQVCARALWR